MNRVVFVCENTFEGILTAIYDAYYSRMDENMTGVCTLDNQSYEFATDYVMVDTDLNKAESVKKAIADKISFKVLKDLYSVFLSCEAGRGEIIYRFLRVAFKMGKRVEGHLTDDWVRIVDKISRRVNREAHRLLGFIRFRELESGILLARIKPDNNVLEIIAPHFNDRMPEENWIIYDYKRGRACIHKRHKGFFITEDMPEIFFTFLDNAEDDNLYADLWKTFFESIAIKERENLGLQKKNLPMKYWDDIIEMN